MVMDLAKYLLHAKWSKYVSNNNDGDYQIKCIPERVKDTRKTLLKTTAILEGEWTSLKKQNKKKQEWFLSMGWASRLVLENGGGVGLIRPCMFAIWPDLSSPSHRDWKIALYLLWRFHMKNSSQGYEKVIPGL